MIEKSIRNLRRRVTKAGKQVYDQGLVRGNSGNISARIPRTDFIIIKPSGLSLGFMKPEDLVLVQLKEQKGKGETNVSKEVLMHTSIYETRDEVGAVVHTHPTSATALAIAGIEVLPLQIEMFIHHPKKIPIIPFEPPGSKELAEAVSIKMKDCDAVVLENHGIVTVGSTVEEACNLNMMVEDAARVQFMVQILAGENIVSWDKLKKKFKTQSISR